MDGKEENILTDIITHNRFPLIKVMGIGKGGSHAVDRMINSDIKLVDFILLDTNSKTLESSKAPVKIQLGRNIIQGADAGGNPEIGKIAAEENTDVIKQALANTDMLFLAAGMGGGTGTGAAPVIAEIAMGMGILTVGIVTKPFDFEEKRIKNANNGIIKLRENVDALIVIPSQKLFNNQPDTCLEDLFEMIENARCQCIQSICELVLGDELINLDFADIKMILSGKGTAYIGSGRAAGENKAKEAVKAAISKPLLETPLNGARSILVSYSGDSDLGFFEADESMELIRSEIDPEAEIIYAITTNNALKDEVIVTVIAAGFDTNQSSVNIFVHSNDELQEAFKLSLDLPSKKHKIYIDKQDDDMEYSMDVSYLAGGTNTEIIAANGSKDYVIHVMEGNGTRIKFDFIYKNNNGIRIYLPKESAPSETM